MPHTQKKGWYSKPNTTWQQTYKSGQEKNKKEIKSTFILDRKKSKGSSSAKYKSNHFIKLCKIELCVRETVKYMEKVTNSKINNKISINRQP